MRKGEKQSIGMERREKTRTCVGDALRVRCSHFILLPSFLSTVAADFFMMDHHRPEKGHHTWSSANIILIHLTWITTSSL